MLFKRAVRVEFEFVFQQEGGGEAISVDPVEDLRVVFEVENSEGQRFYHGAITIYNLAPETRHKLARPYSQTPGQESLPFIDPGITVRLYAGYEDDPPLMFSGDVLMATHTKDGPDWITHMDLRAGYLAAVRAVAQVSYAQPTTAKTIIDKILEPLNIGVQFTSEALSDLNTQRVADYSCSGLAFREADDFLRRYALALIVEDDNRVLVYKPGRSRDTDLSDDNSFSPQNGMIGAPVVTNTGVELRALLRPRLQINQKIVVFNSSVLFENLGRSSSEYVVKAIKNTGDTHGQEWYTDIEAYYSGLQAGVFT